MRPSYDALMDTILGPLISAVLPVLASLLTLIIANRHSAKMARESRLDAAQHAADRRQFESSERRYEDRRDSAIKLQAALDREKDRIYKHVEECGDAPGGMYSDHDFRDMYEALSRVEILATQEVIESARRATSAVVNLFFGQPNAGAALNKELEDYQLRVRDMLGVDVTPSFALRDGL